MNSLSIALSGLQAAQTQSNAVAQNLANLNSQGYKARQVNLSSGPSGVTVASVSQDPTRGPIEPDGTEGSNVNLATEVVNNIIASVVYKANAQVVRKSDQNLGTLLDVLHSR